MTEVTELDKKLAAITLAESESDNLSQWENYLPLIEGMIELGWRPVSVEVTGKEPEKLKIDLHKPTYRGGETFSVPPPR